MEQRTIGQNRVRGHSCSLTSVRGCLRVRVLIAVCLSVCLALLLVDDSTALPPDFFRVGRAAHLGSSSAHWKRSESSVGGSFGGMRLAAVSDDDVLAVVCSYCSSYLSPSIGAACQTNSAESRRICTESFLRDMRTFIQMDD